MLYTTLKKGIEEKFDNEKFKTILSGYAWSQDGGNGGYEYEDITSFIQSFLKSQAIKSNEEEIEYLNDKLKKCNMLIKSEFSGESSEYYRGKIAIIQDQISHLETQNKLIEEDKNI